MGFSQHAKILGGANVEKSKWTVKEGKKEHTSLKNWIKPIPDRNIVKQMQEKLGWRVWEKNTPSRK